MSTIKKSFHITDMHCSACMMKLEGLEDDLPGVIMAQASYLKQSLLVEYDSHQLDEITLRKAIQTLGYTIQD